MKCFGRLGLVLMIAALMLITTPMAAFAKGTSSVPSQPANARVQVVLADRSVSIARLGTVQAALTSSCISGSYGRWEPWGYELVMSECTTQSFVQLQGIGVGVASGVAILVVRIPYGYIIAGVAGLIAAGLTISAGTVGLVDSWFCGNQGVSVGVTWTGTFVISGCRPTGGGAGGAF